MKNEELGNQFMELIAKAMGGNAETLEDKIKEIVQKTVADMGSMTVTHEFRIGDADPSKIEGIVCEEFDEVLSWSIGRTAKGNYNNVMLTGPAGTGKGTIARQLAEALDAEFYEVNAVQDKFELTGFVSAGSDYVPSIFYNACESASSGNEVVFLFDEIDCSIPDVLKLFNEALSSFEFTFPSNESFNFKEHMHFICAANTYGTGADMKYVGNQLDSSTRDRFAMVEIGYDERVELACAGGDKELVEFFHAVRSASVNIPTLETGYRSIERVASMRGRLDMRKVLKQGFTKSLSSDAVGNIASTILTVIPSNPYARALNGEDVTFEAPSTKKTRKTEKKSA